MAKPATSTAFSAKFGYVSQESGANEVVGVAGMPGQVTETAGSSATFSFGAADADSHFATLTSSPADAQPYVHVTYFIDGNANGQFDAGETHLQGLTSDISFADLVKFAVQNNTTHFMAAFDDEGYQPYSNTPSPDQHDFDYNDIVTTVDLGGFGIGGKANSGRGNGPELGLDSNGHVIELDPGNSGGHNHGGDIWLF